MTATTVNSFPSLNHWNSPRAWALAIIALLHVGFFWVLTNGLSINPLIFHEPLPPVYIPVAEPTQPPPKPVKQVEVTPTDQWVVTRPPEPIDFPTDPVPNEPISNNVPALPNDVFGHGDVIAPAPEVVEPRIDTRRGLTEPYYPPQMIREGAEGTVMLSIYILADGRVGEVKLISSSGHAKLDESAIREAKKWRFVPGTSDGQPMAMWKQLPVTFRLNTRM